ncbi:hypothetical protein FYK55_21625 [Roseiconus nitratireducens]|uniref:Glycosyl hydrolase family 98 putative carbohydrate-binding module domain-containing protein n=1 Tax=Roseiconus nitratireducens TaxID=2605748 RepID=A0A5M6CYE5_9BACT|nr:NPCBM/NEW2 domain-containing protein [Roseiconus nitratireducens]KAA5540234.1 hypothetical protein FYK55_21625 [Roseiconus nitratireducens]
MLLITLWLSTLAPGWLAGVSVGTLALAIPVQLETASGEQVEGDWAGTTESAVRIQSGSETREIPFDQMVAMRPKSAPDGRIGPTIHVDLVTGTTIAADDVSLTDTKLQIEPRDQAALEVPLDQAGSIRFRAASPATDPQWLGLTEGENRQDLMVIRRGGDQLDPIQGVVLGLNSKTLQFELDGDELEAPLERLEGVVFRTAPREPNATPVKVSDIFGSTWMASQLEPSGDEDSVLVRLPGNVKHSIPLQQIRSIAWTSGRILLADQPPAQRGIELFIRTSIPANLVSEWFGPHAEGQDLIGSAGGSIEFRVESGFETFAGSVQRDSAVARGGSVAVRILVDGDVRWEQTIKDDAPMGFRVDIAGARRVGLKVLPAGDGDVGDQIRFLKPRFLK